MTATVTGNKAELALRLGISLPTLTGWMQRYPEFPIASRGSNGRSYAFDFAAVFEFLRSRQEEQSQAKAERDEALAQLRLPFDLPNVEPPPKTASPKEELDAWRLRKFQREEMEKAGKLIPTDIVLPAITGVLARLNRDAHSFLRQLARENNWPDPYTRTVEARLGDIQRAGVKDLIDQFGGTADDGPAYAVG